tara:strand:+ start:3254 stop:5788 length:2535 start_codon:yes stop_codon:yes gene_type:complete
MHFRLFLLSIGLALPVFAQQDYERLFDEHYLPRTVELLKRGEYRTVGLACDAAFRRGQKNPQWQVVRLRMLKAQGKLSDAQPEFAKLTEMYADDLPFLIAMHEFHLELGETEAAAGILKRFNAAALKKPLKDRTAEELVALGTGAFLLGADPNKVLDEFYAAAKKKKPELVDSYLAAGNLALAKYDYARASQEFRLGLKQSAQDPDLRFGLAKAFYPSDREQAMANLDRVLNYQANHTGALVMKAEHLINSERWEAEELLDTALLFNQNQPAAWALKSVIATLRDNDPNAAEDARQRALTNSAKRAEVSHLMGRVYSRRYRFKEGAALQREALELDPGFTAAKMQLSSDLMKLGQEEEAWQLAQEIADSDPYNVLAFNFTVLRDQLAKYQTIETEDFIIRMHPDEAEIYGDRALVILNEAHRVLCDKYDLELEEPTLVEFFAEQQDFAIRTFGALGGAGYLGVCFGPVITMNSPGGSASGFSNWEATLWHEFCHVVTLTATHNRMPRWLSEGISVYEEKVRNPVWGQHMTPRYRSRILEENKVTPIGSLSSAFLNAESGEDLMFAYYQSAIVVEFLLDQYGQQSFNAILGSLADGTPINSAIANHTETLSAVEKKFSSFIETLANAYGPGVDWSTPEGIETQNPNSLLDFLKEHPNNFQALQMKVQALLNGKDWSSAAVAAQELIDLFPAYAEGNNGYLLLASAHRGAGDTEAEAAALRELATRKADATPAFLRLLEIDLESENWEPLLANADRQMAVNPFIKTAHHCRACAAQALGEKPVAIDSFKKLLKLGPASPADVNFRLAQLFGPEEPEKAKRHVLDALVDAPRFREAHELLLELKNSE